MNLNTGLRHNVSIINQYGVADAIAAVSASPYLTDNAVVDSSGNVTNTSWYCRGEELLTMLYNEHLWGDTYSDVIQLTDRMYVILVSMNQLYPVDTLQDNILEYPTTPVNNAYDVLYGFVRWAVASIQSVTTLVTYMRNNTLRVSNIRVKHRHTVLVDMEYKK